MHPVIQQVFVPPERVHKLYRCARDVIRVALGFEDVDAFVANGIEESIWAAIFPCDGILYVACGRYATPRMWLDFENELGVDPFRLPEGAVEEWMESAFVFLLYDVNGEHDLEGAAFVIARRMRERRLEREARRVSPPEPEPPPLLSEPEPPPAVAAPSGGQSKMSVELDAIDNAL